MSDGRLYAGIAAIVILGVLAILLAEIFIPHPHIDRLGEDNVGI